MLDDVNWMSVWPANWHDTVNDMWDSFQLRKEFENIFEMKPLSRTGSMGWEFQCDSGYVAKYIKMFNCWVTDLFDMEDYSPSTIKEELRSSR